MLGEKQVLAKARFPNRHSEFRECIFESEEIISHTAVRDFLAYPKSGHAELCAKVRVAVTFSATCVRKIYSRTSAGKIRR